MASRAEDLFRVDRREYLVGEQSGGEKSEWVDGVIYSMSGASKLHVQTVTRIMRLLTDQAEGKQCFIGSSDLLVQTENAYYYPDVVVSCDPSEDDRIEHNPCFIIEVLSPTTKRVDRHEKRDAYCAVATMQDYWIVDPESKIIEVWSRGAEGWSASHHTASDLLTVACLDFSLKVVDLVGP
jgi:Uma2 family endonuclease